MSSTTKLNLSFLSRLKNTVLNNSASLPDITGKNLGEFHADRKMDLPSGEADIYLCSGTGSHAGERFVLKYYRRENAVKQDVLEKLGSIRNACVAPLVGHGEYEGHQYTVRPYYEMPALSAALEYLIQAIPRPFSPGKIREEKKGGFLFSLWSEDPGIPADEDSSRKTGIVYGGNATWEPF